MASRTKLVIALLALAACARAQTPTQPSASRPIPPLTAQFNRNLIFLDPAHGGADSGAHLTSQLLEKDVTLAMALRLRDALTARGFTVVLARQPDDPTPPPPDDRAGVANHLRPVACILLHATTAGRGVQLYASTLTPPSAEPRALPWDTAQASWVPQSLRLANELGTALARTHTPVLIHRADPKPLSNLTCPAIALELAPLPGDDNTTIPVNDTAYQQRVADALAGALVFWKTHADPRPSANSIEPAEPSRPSPNPHPSDSPHPIPPLPTYGPDQPKAQPKPVAPTDRTPEPARLNSPSAAQTASMEPIS